MTFIAQPSILRLSGLVLVFLVGVNIYSQVRPEVTPPKKPAATKPTKTQEAKEPEVQQPQNQRRAAPGPVRENPKESLKYVWIAPGTFEMGCSSGDSECGSVEKPPHQVTITKGYWLGRTEVTVGAYTRYAAATGRQMPPAPDFLGRQLNPGWGNQAMPIVNVTWDEARDYCTWARGRLPTEAEWEYAARGGSSEARYGSLDEVAWYTDNSGRQRLDSGRTWKEDRNYEQRLKDNGNGMHEVGRKLANGYGLHDVLGNVWEWVNDWYGVEYYQSSPSQDPAGPTNGEFRVLRGGSWRSNPSGVRVSYRYMEYPSVRYEHVGFRCVQESGLRLRISSRRPK